MKLFFIIIYYCQFCILNLNIFASANDSRFGGLTARRSFWHNSRSQIHAGFKVCMLNYNVLKFYI